MEEEQNAFVMLVDKYFQYKTYNYLMKKTGTQKSTVQGMASYLGSSSTILIKFEYCFTTRQVF